MSKYLFAHVLSFFDIFFPTCQVMIVRFYVSSSSPSPPLSPPSFPCRVGITRSKVLFFSQVNPNLQLGILTFFGMKMCSQQSRYTTRALGSHFSPELDCGQCKF